MTELQGVWGRSSERMVIHASPTELRITVPGAEDLVVPATRGPSLLADLERGRWERLGDLALAPPYEPAEKPKRGPRPPRKKKPIVAPTPIAPHELYGRWQSHDARKWLIAEPAGDGVVRVLGSNGGAFTCSLAEWTELLMMIRDRLYYTHAEPTAAAE